MVTRWGIISSGKVSFDFALAVRSLPPDEHTLVAAADDNLLRATELCTRHDIPVAYGSYEELAGDPDVDVVHIGPIQDKYLPIARLLLRSGKHVLCEKPPRSNRNGMQELIAIAQEENVFLMEGLRSRFTPLYEKMREEVDAGTIGDVSRVEVNFHGRFTDTAGVPTASYQLVTSLLGKPSKVQSYGSRDDDVNVALSYDDGKSALVTARIHSAARNDATVHGGRGCLTLHSPFWLATSMTVLERTYGVQVPVVGGVSGAGLRREAVEVRRCLQNGLNQSPCVTWEESLIIAELEEEVMRQVGDDSGT